MRGIEANQKQLRNDEMNILNKIGGALQSANAVEMESASAIGLFREFPFTREGRATPAFGSFSRRRNRIRRQFS
jgi:hypothetical protein